MHKRELHEDRTNIKKYLQVFDLMIEHPDWTILQIANALGWKYQTVIIYYRKVKAEYMPVSVPAPTDEDIEIPVNVAALLLGG